MTDKHTPGPWAYEGTGNFVGGADRQRVADVYRDNLDAGERQANARLIAAAPLMLEALRAVSSAPDLLDEMDAIGLDASSKVRAAIAAATGEDA